MTFDYKKYSLENLENWMHDALSCSEASPEEIFDTIKNVVTENYYLYKDQTRRCYELLALLNGIVNFNIDTSPTKWILPVELDGPSGELFLTLPDDLLEKMGWEEGDMLQWEDQKNGTFKISKS